MRTLVVNLTRFGDLLQSQPVFTGLAGRGETTGLVCLRNFAPAAGLLRHLHAVHPIPGERLLAALDRSWPEALGLCLAFADAIRQDFAPSRVINLTPSLPARLLARSLAGEGVPVSGFRLDDSGFGEFSTPWAAFLEATSRHRGSSPFNVADLFFKAAHLDGPREFKLAEPVPAAASSVLAAVGEQCSTPHRGLLGLQLGASEEKRQWPVESFAALAGKIWEEHRLLPVLLGSAAERPLAEAYAAASAAPQADLCGRTGLGELAAAVSSLKVLVTNDTGTMHLAAGLGVPVLALFLATAQPFDTGPYLAGSCCLEPDMECHPCPFSHTCQIGFACRQKITAGAAWAYLDGYLRSGDWPVLPGLGVRAWRTVPGEDGFMDLVSLSGHGEGARAVWNGVQRRAWRRFLDGLPQDFAGHEGDPLPEDFRRGLHETLSQASGLLEVLLQQGRVLQARPLPAMRQKFMSTWRRLDALFSVKPALCALAHLWTRLSQEEGRDMERFLAFSSSVAGLVAALSSLLSPSR
jgi:ADP-heptose:LPS heptosyltransferase